VTESTVSRSILEWAAKGTTHLMGVQISMERD